MRIYWFWPYIHSDQLVLPAAVPRAGDQLVLHTLRDRIPADAAADLPIELRATLATPSDARERSLAWYTNRATTYCARLAQRHQALRAGAFDVCHVVFSNYLVDGLDFRAIARRTRLVFEVHDIVPHQARVPHSIERGLLGLLYRAPGSIVVRHEYLRTELVEQFAIDPERIAVVPWHVPVVQPAPRPVDAPRTVLFFGTMRRNKGVDILLAAIDRLRDLDDVEFVFAGRGFPDVEQQISAAAARDPRIRFEAGYVSADRKHALYSAADLVVLPYTDFASASAVLCDAYAYHCPLVVTDVGALGMSVRADETGWVVGPGNVAELAGALATALADEPGRKRAADHAARAAADRSPAKTAQRLRALYETARNPARDLEHERG